MQNYEKYTSELLAMREIDQKMRIGHQQNKVAWDDKVDEVNTKRLKEIVSEIGWPTFSKVGENASNGAWLLVQHADKDVEFQKFCLDLMKKVPDGDVRKRDLAFLEDRVRVNSHLPQIYGTQFYVDDNGNFGPRPIEDEENIEKRWINDGVCSQDFPDYATYKARMFVGFPPKKT